MKRYSYQALLKNRIVMAALTLGLVTVMVGVFVEIFSTSQRSTISPATRRLITPLNPQLDLSVVERLEGYERVTLLQAKSGAREFLNLLPEREQELTQLPSSIQNTDTASDSAGEAVSPIDGSTAPNTFTLGTEPTGEPGAPPAGNAPSDTSATPVFPLSAPTVRTTAPSNLPTLPTGESGDAGDDSEQVAQP